MDWLYTDVTPEEMAEVNAICGQEAAIEQAAAHTVRTRETIRTEVEASLAAGNRRQAAALTRMARETVPADFLRMDQRSCPDYLRNLLGRQGVTLPTNATLFQAQSALRGLRSAK